VNCLFAGGGENSTGEVEVSEARAGEEKVVKDKKGKEELRREAELSGSRLLDYSMDEEDEGVVPPGGAKDLLTDSEEGEEEEVKVDEGMGSKSSGEEMEVDKEKEPGSERAEEAEVRRMVSEEEVGEVFLTEEEQEANRAKLKRREKRAARIKANLSSADDSRKKEELEKERLLQERKLESEREERRKVEREAEEAKDLGRRMAAKSARSKVDNRYFTVRSIRAGRVVGRELNRKVVRKERTETEEVDACDGFAGEDERWLRNYNIHNTDRGVNVSSSFNPRSRLCFTCLRDPHPALKGGEDEAVTFVLCDQYFPANVPGMDGGECLRVVRVEDGTLQEMVLELTIMIGRGGLAPGTTIMLGSLTQMGTDGTAVYTAEWQKARNKLKRELGEVTVLPFLPILGEDKAGPHLVRTLLEFLSWYDDLEDPEAVLLRSVRKEYVQDFLTAGDAGEGWADVLQVHKMPNNLRTEGTMRYNSRSWGSLPHFIAGTGEHEEAAWIGRICIGLNRAGNYSLATSVASGRTLAAVRELEEENERLQIEVAGPATRQKPWRPSSGRASWQEKLADLAGPSARRRTRTTTQGF